MSATKYDRPPFFIVLIAMGAVMAVLTDNLLDGLVGGAAGAIVVGAFLEELRRIADALERKQEAQDHDNT